MFSLPSSKVRIGTYSGRPSSISDNSPYNRSWNIANPRIGNTRWCIGAELLGWPADRVEAVDEDQGHSGQSAVGRPGFQYLLAEISLDHVGLILGLEMSRLARSNKDWHHLLELCGIFRVLLADQDGLYDPTDYNKTRHPSSARDAELGSLPRP